MKPVRSKKLPSPVATLRVVADRAPAHREAGTSQTWSDRSRSRAEAAGFEQQRFAIEQAREDGRQRGNYGGASVELVLA